MSKEFKKIVTLSININLSVLIGQFGETIIVYFSAWLSLSLCLGKSF